MERIGKRCELNVLIVYIAWQKADKEHLDAKVNRNQFDSTCDELNQMINDLINKLLGTVSYRVLEKFSSNFYNNDCDKIIDDDICVQCCLSAGFVDM